MEIEDGELGELEWSEVGLAALRTRGGRRLGADLFIDASGFRAELIGGAMREPFESFAGSLFCDRAVVGGWDRDQGEPILPYTVADTMQAGWAWWHSITKTAPRRLGPDWCQGSPLSAWRESTPISSGCGPRRGTASNPTSPSEAYTTSTAGGWPLLPRVA